MPDSPAPLRLVPARRLGVVVPGGNPALEPELRGLLPEAVGIHVTRLPLFPGQDLRLRTDRYLEHLGPCFASFGALPLDALLVGVTGPFYANGADEDRALAARLSADAGRPVLVPSLAIRDALDALGIGRIVLFSPYPDWLTERAIGYYTRCGLDLVGVHRVSSEFAAYDLTPAEVEAALRRLAVPAGAAVVVSGTGAPTAEAAAAVATLPFPVISSNLACVLAVLRQLGFPATPAFAAAAPRLARLLPR